MWCNATQKQETSNRYRLFLPLLLTPPKKWIIVFLYDNSGIYSYQIKVICCGSAVGLCLIVLRKLTFNLKYHPSAPTSGVQLEFIMPFFTCDQKCLDDCMILFVAYSLCIHVAVQSLGTLCCAHLFRCKNKLSVFIHQTGGKGKGKTRVTCQSNQYMKTGSTQLDSVPALILLSIHASL